ncbi:toll-like receptor 4 [Ptychodera flava]|uniref:toll-like receptor 4 n=1 Tax=Ptychodera flava TaxID=63121 RepID=UPI00396A9B00
MKTLSIPISNTNLRFCILMAVMNFPSITSEAVCKIYNSIDVDCSYRDLTTVPKELPSSAKYLDLSNNYISSFTPKSFENLQMLEELNMELSRDLNIDSDAFIGFHKLRRLVFQGFSQITYGKGTFKRLPSLRVLEFPIRTFMNTPDSPFSNLTNLSKLTIRNPDPSDAHPTFPTSLFKGLRNLEELSVSVFEPENASGKFQYELLYGAVMTTATTVMVVMMIMVVGGSGGGGGGECYNNDNSQSGNSSDGGSRSCSLEPVALSSSSSPSSLQA